MSYTLCVIDMQEIFSSSQDAQIQKSCIREIKKAIRDRSVILFVEYAGYNPTIRVLTDIVEQANYKRAYHVIKSRNDGGKEVTDFLAKHHLPKMNMRVCGVNTDYCVLARGKASAKPETDFQPSRWEVELWIAHGRCEARDRKWV